MNLPIDVVPNSRPPRFKWTQHITGPTGDREVTMEGSLTGGAEQAVTKLIHSFKEVVAERDRLLAEVGRLVKQNEGLMERIARQSDQLGKNAEKAAAQPAMAQAATQAAQPASSRKGR